MALEPMTNYGWSFHDNTLSIIWDSHDNIATVFERINVILKCATGCSTKLRGCRKNGKDCSVGCGCRNCDNYAQEEERKDTENELAAIAIDEDLGNARLALSGRVKSTSPRQPHADLVHSCCRSMYKRSRLGSYQPPCINMLHLIV